MVPGFRHFNSSFMAKHRRVVVKTMDATTTNAQKLIISFLLYHGHSASRINTMGYWNEKAQSYIEGGARKGFSDIAVCIKDRNGIGRAVAIEVKIGNDEPNADQIKFKAEWERAGGIHYYAEGETPQEAYENFMVWYNGIMEVL